MRGQLPAKIFPGLGCHKEGRPLPRLFRGVWVGELQCGNPGVSHRKSPPVKTMIPQVTAENSLLNHFQSSKQRRGTLPVRKLGVRAETSAQRCLEYHQTLLFGKTMKKLKLPSGKNTGSAPGATPAQERKRATT